MSDDFVQFARVGAHGRYLNIANDYFSKFKEKEKEASKYVQDLHGNGAYNDDAYNADHDRLLDEWQDNGLVSTIFYALFLESFIYDYGCIFLGDKYVTDNLDKLDFVSKWIVIPKIAHNYDVDRSKEFFSSLKRLSKDRNSLIHSKSRPMNPIANRSYMDDHKEFKNSVLNANRATKLALSELDNASARYPVKSMFEVI